MAHGDTSSKENRHVDQAAVITNLQEMRWLRNNSSFLGQIRTAIPRKNKLQTSTSNKNAKIVNKEGIKIHTATKLGESSDNVSFKDLEKILNSSDTESQTLQSGTKISDKNQSLEWNESINTAHTLLKAPPLVQQRFNIEDIMGTNVAQDLVTAQFEQFRIDESKTDKLGIISNVNTDSEHVSRDIDSRKECHDSNNNQAKSEHKLNKGDCLASETIISAPCCVKSKFNLDTTARSAGSTEHITQDLHSTSKSLTKQTKGGSKPKQLTAEKGRHKEQDVTRNQIPMSNDSSNKTRFNSNNVLKSSRAEDYRKYNETGNTQKCHKVQITRTQSYNDQYVRNRPVLRSQTRYSRTITKSDQDLSSKVSIVNSHSCVLDAVDGRGKFTPTRSFSSRESLSKSYDQSGTDHEVGQDSYHRSYNVPGAGLISARIDQGRSEKSCFGSQPPKSVFPKRSQQYSKTFSERNDKEITDNTQKSRRDSSVYRRSSDSVDAKYVNTKSRTNDQNRRSVGESGGTKNGRTENQKTSSSLVNHGKTSSASTKNKTEPTQLSHASIDNAKDLATPVSVACDGQEQLRELSSTVIEIPNKRETAHEISDNLTAVNSGSKNVKFSGSVEDQDGKGYFATSPQKALLSGKSCTNPFLTDGSNAGNPVQPMTTVQKIPGDNFFDHSGSYSQQRMDNVQYSCQDSQQLDSISQKDGQIAAFRAPSYIPYNMGVPQVGYGQMQYHNTPALFLNQYNTMQSMSGMNGAKSTESSNSSETTCVPNTSRYTMSSHTAVPGDQPSLMMHGSQSATVPSPMYHSHPVLPSQEEWNIAHQDAFYYGNVMGAPYPINAPLQNVRPICPTDYSSFQQTGYLQHPVFYMPSMCMQGWNSVLPCSGPLMQNAAPYAACNMPHQVMRGNNLMEPVSCPVAANLPSNPYKQFPQTEGNYHNDATPPKLDSTNAYKSPNAKVMSNTADVHSRVTQQYHPASEQQIYAQDAPAPYTYTTPIISSMKKGQGQQIQPKYPQQRSAAPVNYQLAETSVFGNADNATFRSEAECIPPMVSPRECMFYGINYSRKTDYIPNVKSDAKH